MKAQVSWRKVLYWSILGCRLLLLWDSSADSYGHASTRTNAIPEQ